MNKVIVITGAGGVLCSCLAKSLAKGGNRIALLDLKSQAAQAVADEINMDGGRAIAICANVLDEESLKAARETVRAEFGKCDILINGAGGNHPKGTTTAETFCEADMADEGAVSFFDLKAENIRFVFDLNFLGAFLTTQEFARDMIGKGGSIINISSMNAFSPLTKIPAYSAAKAAVSNFTEWLAVHFANEGIRVNAIAPGFFVTEQNRGLLFNEDKTPTARTKKILSQTPMGRFGEPAELCGTVSWLADEAQSGFVTGIVVPIDGGFSAYSGV